MKHTADVVRALKLDVMSHINGGNPINESRWKIGSHANFVQKLEESAGTNYDYFFEYHSAYDCFEPYASFDKIIPPQTKSLVQN